MEKLSKSALKTENIGKKLAKTLKGTEIIALYGDLGAGKTAFTRGIADFFGIKDLVSSPTFSIMNEYQSDKFKIYHFDMYRVNSFENLESTGFFYYIDNGIIIIEWAENVEEFLPNNMIKIYINKTNDENTRIIKIEGAEIS